MYWAVFSRRRAVMTQMLQGQIGRDPQDSGHVLAHLVADELRRDEPEPQHLHTYQIGRNYVGHMSMYMSAHMPTHTRILPV